MNKRNQSLLIVRIDRPNYCKDGMLKLPLTKVHPLPAYNCYPHDSLTQHAHQPKIYTIWPNQQFYCKEPHRVYCQKD